jgi:hypothetical protein
MIIRQNACVIRQVKREIQASDALLCKHRSTHLYRCVYSMRLRYSIKPAIYTEAYKAQVNKK